MNTLTETEKAYLAGFVDGEGCISITKQLKKESRNPSYRLSLIISQTNYDFLKAWRDRAGIGSINEKRFQTFGLENARPSWDWRISGREATELLNTILPFLQIKSAEAKLAIEFQNGIGRSKGRGWQVPRDLLERRERIYQQMHDLKTEKSRSGRKRKIASLYQ